jgi:K+-transporting ATPase KdpF subunit
MTEFIYWLGGLFALAVFVYLVIALLVPERF